MADERPTPRDEDIPGGFPVTPSVNSLNQLTPTVDTADRLEAGLGAPDRNTGASTYDSVTSGQDNYSYSASNRNDNHHNGTPAALGASAAGAAAGGYLAS